MRLSDGHCWCYELSKGVVRGVLSIRMFASGMYTGSCTIAVYSSRKGES